MNPNTQVLQHVTADEDLDVTAIPSQIVEPCPICDLAPPGPCPACDARGWIVFHAPTAP